MKEVKDERHSSEFWNKTQSQSEIFLQNIKEKIPQISSFTVLIHCWTLRYKLHENWKLHLTPCFSRDYLYFSLLCEFLCWMEQDNKRQFWICVVSQSGTSSLLPRLSLLAHTTKRKISWHLRMAYRETSFDDVTTIRTKSSPVNGGRTPGY